MPARNLLSAFTGLTAILLGGCNQRPEAKTPKVPVVRIVKAMAKQITEYEYFTGRTEAVKTVEVRARVTGYLDKIIFTPGTVVKKDQLLFVIDPRPYKATFDQADSQVALAEAQLGLARADLERAKEIAKTPGAISQQDLDKYAATMKSSEASIQAAKASRETAALYLLWTDVKSPIEGLTSRNLLDVGNLVTQDQTLLTTVVSEGIMYGYFDVDERSVLRVRELIRVGKVKSVRDNHTLPFVGASMLGLLGVPLAPGPLLAAVTVFVERPDHRIPVELGLANEPDRYPHEGKLDFANNAFDSGTGTMQLRGEFPNPRTAGGGPAYLTPGMFIRIRFPIGDKKERLLVPQIAIGTDQDKKFLLVVNDKNVVEFRPVTLGPIEGDLQVIEPILVVHTDKGVRQARPGENGEPSLVAGERVIVGGLQRVRPGLTVEVKDWALEVR